MEYQATFEINCGESPGFGVKYPAYERRTEKISAENPQVAYDKAMTQAGKFADDYLSDPVTGFTTVLLLGLSSPDGGVSFDASKAVVKRSMLEHLLALALVSEEKRTP